MNKAKNKLVLLAVLVVFVLLTLLVGIINGINFTMAAEDADAITQSLSQHRGSFGPDEKRPEGSGGFFGQGQPGRMGPMGPTSPDMTASVRYFTYAFDKKTGAAEKVVLEISAINEQEAEEWARSLLNESTGWMRGTYRYRVYEADGRTYVTVIDQGRELLPCYRILIISVIGEAVSLLLLFLFLLYAGKKLFAPLEDADRKQRQFIDGMEKEFQVPLTVINADVELLERGGGANAQTNSIRRQAKHMSRLLKGLSSLSVFAKEADFQTAVPLSEFLQGEIDLRQDAYAQRGLRIETEIEPGITLQAAPEDLKRLVGELLDNTGKYAVTWAKFSLKSENKRIFLLCENDAALPDGPCDQAFDRFTTLSNAPEGSLGLGLSAVKELVQRYNGRVKASVANSVFALRIAL